MEGIIFFISNFILKRKKERYFYFLEKDILLFMKELERLEYSLNDKCKLIELNVLEFLEKDILGRNVSQGIYLDPRFSDIQKNYFLDDNIIFNDSLFIIPDEKVAYFFHHEGWLYFCSMN